MQNPIPPQFQHFSIVPDLVKTIELRVNLSHAGTNELVIEANDDQGAEDLLGLVEKSFDMVRSQAAEEIARLKQDSDPVQQAMGRYQERMMNEMSTALVPQREGARLVLFRLSDEGPLGMLTMTAVSGILVALLLPAVQAAREAARRNTSMNNMKRINLALHNYAATQKNSFPPHANFDANGKPLLSWRVHILPYLEQQALYNQFHLDESWDSEHNKELLARMPDVYSDPSSTLSHEQGRTNYLGVKGEGMVFDGSPKGTTFMEIRDGTTNTIMLLQVNDQRATDWTKPDDWEFDAKNPLNGLVPSLHPGVFLASFADAHVKSISEDLDPTVFKTLLTIAGGEVVQNP